MAVTTYHIYVIKQLKAIKSHVTQKHSM